MKKTLFSLLTVLSLFLLTACGGGNTTQYDNTVTPKLGDTIISKSFELTLNGYTIGKAISKYETYQDLVYLDVSIKNTSNKAMKYSTNNYVIYSPKNVLLNAINNTNYPTSIAATPSIRRGGTTDAQIIFPFVGYGTYYIEFKSVNGTVTAEINVKE